MLAILINDKSPRICRVQALELSKVEAASFSGLKLITGPARFILCTVRGEESRQGRIRV